MKRFREPGELQPQYEVENPEQILAFVREKGYESAPPEVLERAIEVIDLFLAGEGRYPKSDYHSSITGQLQSASEIIARELADRAQRLAA